MLKHVAKRRSNSRKGALIKGMSRKLPGDILIDPVFKEKLEELMKGYSGIYALYRGEKLYYVGLTKDLRGRVRHHLEDRHGRKWDHFKIFRIPRSRYLKDIETLVLQIMKPKGNRSMGWVPRDADLNRTLREVFKEYSKKMKLLKKALR